MNVENGEINISDLSFKKYGISWTEYVKLFFVHVVIFVPLVAIAVNMLMPQYFWYIVPAFIGFQAIILTLSCLSLHSQYVFIDKSGLWFHRGFLPWTKGFNGIIWENCGGAMYNQGFFPYIINTYTIIIEHKYTQTARISVANIYKGKNFCNEVANYMNNNTIGQ